MMIDVALVGCGHMGRHHARTIDAAAGARLVAVVDIRKERAQAIAERTGARVDQVIPGSVDAVVIATPTTTHAQLAGPLLDRGQWCLVEKPMAASPDEAKGLDTPRLVVGHSERFNPAVRALGACRPKLVQSRRMAPPGRRARDVDVVLDLMIHDLDLVLCWADPSHSVEIIDAAGVGRGGWDVASVRVRVGDMVASLSASRVAEKVERIAVVSEPGRSAALDLLRGVARTDNGPLPPVDGRDALTAQWDAFARAVRGEPSESPTGTQGLAALRLAARVCEALEGR